MKVKRQRFSCQREGLTIAGTIYRREGHKGIPLILSHGFLSNQRHMRAYAAPLAQEGYVVFTYDFCGGALHGKSDGSFEDMSIDTEREDLKAVMAYVAACEDVDAGRLILMGESQGGFVSCLVAAEQPERISKMLLLYPALCIPDDARRGQMRMLRFDPAHIEETLVSRPIRFSAKYPKSAMDIDIYAAIKKISCPMLLLHGSEDEIVDVAYAKRAEEANAAVKLVVLQGAGHGFGREEQQQAIGQMVQFLRETK